MTKEVSGAIVCASLGVGLREAASVATGYTTNYSHQSSPRSPTYSVCGSRLRWINTAQLLRVTHSQAFSHPITTRPLRDTSSRASKHYCHREDNFVSFISVANLPIFVHNDSRVIGTTSVPDDTTSPALHNHHRSTFTMPVPATYRAEWRIDHAPAKHLASAKLKKLLSEKEIRRDDNYNIQEVTESEVPRDQWYSGLNGNGVHTEECPQRPQTTVTNYTDSVKIIKTPARQEYKYGVHYDIDDSRVYREAVRLIPGVPNNGRHYSTMTRCFIGSKIRRYTESVYITLGAPQPKQFTTSVFVFPKACRETFVSSVEHHDEETMKLYKVGVKMEAKDYVSVKFVQID